MRRRCWTGDTRFFRKEHVSLTSGRPDPGRAGGLAWEAVPGAVLRPAPPDLQASRQTQCTQGLQGPTHCLAGILWRWWHRARVWCAGRACRSLEPEERAGASTRRPLPSRCPALLVSLSLSCLRSWELSCAGQVAGGRASLITIREPLPAVQPAYSKQSLSPARPSPWKEGQGPHWPEGVFVQSTGSRPFV